MFRFRSIDYIRLKIKALALILDTKDAYTILTVVFVALSGYFLGQLSAIESGRKPVVIEQFFEGSGGQVSQKTIKEEPAKPLSGQTAAVAASKGLYVGSKSSDKYHALHCSGAQRIAEANKVWFASKEEAERAGYSPAGNCKGI
jgi:hypothetical protein